MLIITTPLIHAVIHSFIHSFVLLGIGGFTGVNGVGVFGIGLVWSVQDFKRGISISDHPYINTSINQPTLC